MAGIFFQVKKFEAKKQALAAESEAYRQVLRWQLQNLSLHSAKLKHKVSSLTPFLRLLPTAGTLFGSPLSAWLFRRKKSSRLRLLGKAYFAWRAFGKFRPVLRFLTSKRNSAAEIRSQQQSDQLGRQP